MLSVYRVLGLILVFAAWSGAQSAPRGHIQTSINDNERFVLKGNTRPTIERGLARDEGQMPASFVLPRMVLHFAMTGEQRSDLAQLLRDQQNRRSPQYHRFLTPEQYALRFGLDGADLDKVVKWLESSGFSNLQLGRSKRWVSFSGSAAHAEAAFHVALRRYSINGETHFANSVDPQIPKAFAGVVESIRGLNNFAMKPSARVRPRFSSSMTDEHFLAPDDWQTIYDVKPLYGAGFDGTGVTIAVVGQSDFQLTDVQAFRSASGLPPHNPRVVVPPGSVDPGIQKSTGEEIEADLDVEWAGAIAKNADVLFIPASATSGNGVTDSIVYAIDNNVAPILSTSYSVCEADLPAAQLQTFESLFQQANAQGMTIVASSGDTGAAACDTSPSQVYATHGLAVNYPASSEYVTSIGGTSFGGNSSFGSYWSSSNDAANGSALSYIPEIVWNNASTLVSGGATGGGASGSIAKPTWQSGPGVPADGARDVPDLAFAADPLHGGLLICEEGSCVNGFLDNDYGIVTIGGTSAGAPPFASLLALIIQEHDAGGGRLGNINPNLYALAQISSNVFHDITSGNNEVPCGTGAACPSYYIGYSAGPGYDQTTGWGSLDAYNFAEQWYGDIQVSVSPGTLTVQPGTSATAAITLTPQNNFTGPVSFTCSVPSSLVDVSCSIPSTPLNTSGTTTITITAATTARTPFWKRLRVPPPSSRAVFLVCAAFLLVGALSALAGYRGESKPSFRLFAYSLSAVFILAVTVGAVSCGGGGSSGSSGGTPPAPLSLSCNLPGATTGVAYSGTCTARGGTGAVTFSITGVLPAGLSINSATGAITGTPSAPSTSSFTVTVTDSGAPAQTATVSAVITEEEPLTLFCNLPANANNAMKVSANCFGSGGTKPYAYSVSAGALPAGLALDSASGAITGLPTTPGTSSFTLQATDSSSPSLTATQQVSNFVVALAPPILSCPQRQNDNVGEPYSLSCAAVGGTAPLTYSITSGTLPSGLALNSATGLISGVPTAPATFPAIFTFTLSVTDSGSPAQSLSQPVTFQVQPTSPLYLFCFLDHAPLGAPVYSPCMFGGGNPPYTTSLLAGTLPPGLTLSPTWVGITGTPTAMGTYAFTIGVVDSSSPPLSAQAQFNVQVGPRAQESGVITITATSGGIVNTTTLAVTVP